MFEILWKRLFDYQCSYLFHVKNGPVNIESIALTCVLLSVLQESWWFIFQHACINPSGFIYIFLFAKKKSLLPSPSFYSTIPMNPHTWRHTVHDVHIQVETNIYITIHIYITINIYITIGEQWRRMNVLKWQQWIVLKNTHWQW